MLGFRVGWPGLARLTSSGTGFTSSCSSSRVGGGEVPESVLELDILFVVSDIEFKLRRNQQQIPQHHKRRNHTK